MLSHQHKVTEPFRVPLSAPILLFGLCFVVFGPLFPSPGHSILPERRYRVLDMSTAGSGMSLQIGLTSLQTPPRNCDECSETPFRTPQNTETRP
jgi:hypothetical protein